MLLLLPRHYQACQELASTHSFLNVTNVLRTILTPLAQTIIHFARIHLQPPAVPQFQSYKSALRRVGAEVILEKEERVVSSLIAEWEDPGAERAKGGRERVREIFLMG